MHSQKVKCSQCLSRYLTPTGKKCKYLQDKAPMDQVEDDSKLRSPVRCHQRKAASVDVQMQILQ